MQSKVILLHQQALRHSLESRLYTSRNSYSGQQTYSSAGKCCYSWLMSQSPHMLLQQRIGFLVALNKTPFSMLKLLLLLLLFLPVCAGLTTHHVSNTQTDVP